MTVRNPQLFHSASIDDIEKFVTDPEWVLEQKVDGMRCLTVITKDGIEFFTRGGQPLKSSAAKLHFENIRNELDPLLKYAIGYGGELVFDGELVTDSGTLVLLDLPYMRIRGTVVVDPKLDKLWQRRDAMFNLWVAYLPRRSKIVTIVAQANTEEFKRRLVEDVVNANLEGFIAKRSDSPYDEGQRVKHSLKIKITQTADVIVTGKNSGESRHSKRGGDKINYEFGVFTEEDREPGSEGGQPSWVKHIGNCSGIGKENAEVGDVIEVEYLYAGAGGKLVQPRMLRVRHDKPLADCTIDQLKYVNKEVL